MRLVVGTVTISLLLGSQAWATPILGAFASSGTDITSSDTAVEGPVHVSSASTVFNSTFWAVAEASYGMLKARAEISVVTPPYGFIRGFAEAYSTFSDLITVVSDNLVAGTLVSFRVSNVLSGYLQTNDNTSAASHPTVAGWEAAGVWSSWQGFGLTGAQGYLAEGEYRYNIGHPGETYEYNSNCVLPTSCGSVDFVTLEVGKTYTVSHTLRVIADVGGLLFGYALSNYGSTARFFLDPVDEGYQYLTASGIDYRTSGVDSVPEPATLVLLGVGLAAFGTARLATRK